MSEILFTLFEANKVVKTNAIPETNSDKLFLVIKFFMAYKFWMFIAIKIKKNTENKYYILILA